MRKPLRDGVKVNVVHLTALLLLSDWSGALGLLKFQMNTEEAAYQESVVTEKLFWMAYCYMHLGTDDLEAPHEFAIAQVPPMLCERVLFAAVQTPRGHRLTSDD